MRFKSLEALARGYVWFRVNDHHFPTYGMALAAKNAIPPGEPVTFTGLHIRRGWLGFYRRWAQVTVLDLDASA